MLDLPDHGYIECRVFAVDAGGPADGSLGGASDYINRPGTRYGVQLTLPQIASAKDARIFQSLLEQGSREDVSYPWPLDMRSLAAGVPLINGSTPPGASVPLKGLVPGFVMRVGQPFAVVLADGSGSIHKARSEVIADNAGHATVPIFPWTRTTFADALVVEIEHPRIRGTLSWDGSTQPAYGRRGFSFTITERK
jgi:hypothetical protein